MAEARDAGRVQETTQVLEAQQVRAAAPAVHLQLMMSSNAGAGHQANREQAAVCNDSDDVKMEQLWDDPSPCATQYGAILENLDAIKTTRAPPAGIMQPGLEQGAARIDKLEPPQPEDGGAAEMVRQHPVFEKLVRAHYSCRKLIASEEQRKLMDGELMKVITSLSSGGGAGGGARGEQAAKEAEVDVDGMLEEYVEAINNFTDQMRKPHEQATKAFNALTIELEKITKAAASPGDDPNTFIGFLKTNTMFAGMPAGRKCEILKEHYKRRHAEALMEIHDDFMGLKKTKKLPEDAVSHLKIWWHAHIHWPYPTEDEKAQFSAATDLEGTQISNWFINQRKRHWHKFFWDGLPHSEREARDHIKKHNLLARLHKLSA